MTSSGQHSWIFLCPWWRMVLWYTQDPTKETYHHSKCNIMVTATDLEGVYLTDPNQVTETLHRINFENINPNANYISQLSNLNSKLTGTLQASFKTETHPACKSISSTPVSTTVWVTGSTFIRNMGDCSITFKCQAVTVVPTMNMSTCFARLPVQDIKGRQSFLD